MDQLRPSTTSNSTTTLDMPANNSTQDITELVMPTKQESGRTTTKEFMVEDMKEEPSKIKIDFFEGTKPNDFVKAPTEQARPEVVNNPTTQFINPAPGIPGIGSYQQQVKTKEEIRGSVAILIALIDYALSFVGMMLAGEGTQSQYTADAQQKKLLETALVDWMYVKNKQLSPTVALVLAILGAYGFMLIKAGKTRFDNKKKQPVPPKKVEPIIAPPVYTESRTPTKTAQITEQQMEHYKNIKPPVKPPAEKLRTETIYTDIGNGVMEPRQRLIADINPWEQPDTDIVAKSKEELDDYILKGIYPKFLKNSTNNNVRPIRYDRKTGKPLLQGAPPRRR